MTGPFKRGTVFRHGRLLDTSFVPGPGQRFADAPKVVCRVTRVALGRVYYAVGNETKAHSFASAERLLADGAEVLARVRLIEEPGGHPDCPIPTGTVLAMNGETATVQWDQPDFLPEIEEWSTERLEVLS
jgi:hypothetical protein